MYRVTKSGLSTVRRDLGLLGLLQEVPRTTWLKRRTLFLAVPETGEPKVKGPAEFADGGLLTVPPRVGSTGARSGAHL